MKELLLTISALLIAAYAHSVSWEELDKSPEGAHRGQMLVGAFATFGIPKGKIINNEKGFVKNSTYTFQDSLITKKITLLHYAISYGLFIEYMPVDYLGLKLKARNLSILQSTNFGSEYRNWSRIIYNDYSAYFGPSLHFPMRRNWDISLTPLIGYAFGRYVATPIAARLIFSDYSNINQYGIAADASFMYFHGNRKQVVNSLSAGADLNLSLYISGGLFLSFGCEWIMNMLKFNKKFYLTNPIPSSGLHLKSYRFFARSNSSSLHSISFVFSAGYAVSN